MVFQSIFSSKYIPKNQFPWLINLEVKKLNTTVLLTRWKPKGINRKISFQPVKCFAQIAVLSRCRTKYSPYCNNFWHEFFIHFSIIMFTLHKNNKKILYVKIISTIFDSICRVIFFALCKLNIIKISYDFSHVLNYSNFNGNREKSIEYYIIHTWDG